MATEILNNKGGRPRGSSNKTSLEIRTAWVDFVLLNFKDAQSIYDGLGERDKMGVLKGISELVLPKRTTLEIEEIPEQVYDYSLLTFEQNMQLIELLETATIKKETPLITYQPKQNDKPF